jgi:hypothetical protein
MSATNNYISLLDRSSHVVDFVFFNDRSLSQTQVALDRALDAVELAKQDGTKLRMVIWSKSRWPEFYASVDGLKEVGELNRKNFNAALEDEDEV